MGLVEDLERTAATASAHGAVIGVLAAEPAGRHRLYLVALEGAEPRWVVLDDDGVLVDRREDVRDTASMIALCELAADVAGGGDLAGLRGHVEELRAIEQTAELEGALAAISELERVIGVPPRLAAPAYLDAVGAATIALERALGDIASPFADALRSGTGVVDEFARDVERGYLIPLR